MAIEGSASEARERRIRLGMVGGGSGAFIGAVHRIAARIESLADHAHEALPWTKPFAGHLIAIGERPRREGDLPSTPARH